MPFHAGVYYPYNSDTPGTHSSAGIPSLVNSPPSQQSINGHAVPPSGMTPSSATSTALPFKFRPRRESVDWRRINAVDVDLVVSQLDVDALQEYINTVTFCSLDGERCQRCHSPVDPALVKLLRLAQLTVEWLLHCQEFLTANLHALEERLVAAGREREQLLAQMKKREEEVKELTNELKQRKKMIRNQQSLFMPRIVGGQKCLHCDKSFISSSFLQSHMQRRHPDEYEIQLQSDSEKKSQIESLKVEISSLKEEIVQQQQALQAKTAQEKEQQSMHKDLLREIDRFKAEEMARMDRKIEDSRDGIRREMEFFYSRNIQALNEVNQSQIAKHERSEPERDLDNYKEMQTQVLQKLEHQLKKQDKKWEIRLQDVKAQHESEKNQLLNELSRMQSSLSEHEDRSQRLQEEMGRRLQDKEQTIKAQREQIRNISSNPPTKVIERQVIVSPPALEPKPEPKPKRVVHEEPLTVLKLDPIQELSEEDKDSSSNSEKRPVEKKSEPSAEKKQKASTSVMRKIRYLKKELRPALEQEITEKLAKLGVKPDQSRLTNKELSSVLAKMRSKRDSIARAMPDFLNQREELAKAVEQRLRHQRRSSSPAAELQTRSTGQGIRVRSSSLPSSVTQVMSRPPAKQSKTPQPAPRIKTTPQPKTSTPTAMTAPKSFVTKTPPFSSDEESEEDSDTDEEDQEPQKRHQDPRAKSPQSRPYQTTPVQVRTNKTSLAQPRQGSAKQSPPPNSQHPAGSLAGATKTAVTKVESDDEWSEVSELREINPRQLQSYREQNGSVDKRKFGKENKINDLARKLEKQFADRVVKKPAGGVSVLPERKDEVQELTYTDLEESSDWVVSSLEDGALQEVSKPAHSSGSLRKSLDSPSTSVWGTSTGKGPKSGLTDAGTGSTLKTSLHSFSDFSDSDDT